MSKIFQAIRAFVFIKPSSVALACVCIAGSLSACSDEDEPETGTGSLETNLSFFVSSTTHDGNLGGISGADKICQDLATDAGAGSRTWRAYLSVENNGSPQHAKDRIGTGPWYNADGIMVAANLAALHALAGDPDLFITEKKEKVNGQWNGVTPNQHDIMTGTDSTGSLAVTMALDMATGMMVREQTTCSDWTSNTLTPGPQVGHTDGMGPAMDTSIPRYTSWNGGHPGRGCSSDALAMSGGAGRIYCFAAN